MSTINREEAVHLLMAYPGPIDKKIVRKILETMPACNQLATDCISRRAVNSLIDELARSLSDRRSGLARGRDYGEIMLDIIRLPSAQPELANYSTKPANDSGELVSKQAAIEEVARWKGYLDEDMIFRIQTGIKRLLTAQPERKKGEWIHDGYDIPHGVDWMHCSVCGRREPHVPAAMTNFCPNCGADMRGEQNG